MDHLQNLARILNSDEVTFELSDATEPIPFPHALFSFSSDVNDYDVFQLIVSVLDVEVLQSAFESIGDHDLLSVLYPFPYEMENEDRAKDVIRLLNLMNKTMVIGAFGYDEVEHRCFFRHSLILNRAKPDYLLVSSTLLLIKDVLNTYTEVIEDVSVGAISTETLLEKFREAQKGD